MKNSKRFKAALVLMVFVFSLIVPKAVLVQAAIPEMTVDEDEYNVYISDYPSGVGTVYAKFNTKQSNVESYELSLFDDYDSEEKMKDALKKSGDSADKYEMLAMDILLYKEDSEGEFYPVTNAMEMTLICEVPSDFMDLESKVKIFAVNSSGKVDNIAYTLVDVDGYICMKFTVKKFTQYAFALANKDIAAYEDGLYEDDEEDTATPIPTKKPTAVPTKPVQNQGSSGTTTNNQSGSKANSAKDSVPKTGDDFSAKKLGISILVTGTLFISAMYYIKKK